MNPQGPGTSNPTSTTQVEKEMAKEEVTRILGDPTDIQNSEDVET